MSCENLTVPSDYLALPISQALLAVIAVLFLIICVTYSLLVAFFCKMYTVTCHACCEVGFLCWACRLSRRELDQGRNGTGVGHQELSPRGYGSTDPYYEDVNIHQETQDQRPPAALPRDVDDTEHYVGANDPPPLERALMEAGRKRRVQGKDPEIITPNYANVPSSRSHKSRDESYLDVQPSLTSRRGVPLLDDDGGEHQMERQTSGSKKGGQDHTATGHSDV